MWISEFNDYHSPQDFFWEEKRNFFFYFSLFCKDDFLSKAPLFIFFPLKRNPWDKLVHWLVQSSWTTQQIGLFAQVALPDRMNWRPTRLSFAFMNFLICNLVNIVLENQIVNVECVKPRARSSGYTNKESSIYDVHIEGGWYSRKKGLKCGRMWMEKTRSEI